MLLSACSGGVLGDGELCCRSVGCRADFRLRMAVPVQGQQVRVAGGEEEEGRRRARRRGVVREPLSPSQALVLLAAQVVPPAGSAGVPAGRGPGPTLHGARLRHRLLPLPRGRGQTRGNIIQQCRRMRQHVRCCGRRGLRDQLSLPPSPSPPSACAVLPSVAGGRPPPWGVAPDAGRQRLGAHCAHPPLPPARLLAATLALPTPTLHRGWVEGVECGWRGWRVGGVWPYGWRVGGGGGVWA